MSFILDALRKSERDRQTQQGPSVYYAVESEPQNKAPPWAVAIIVLLALLLVALVLNWFSDRSSQVQVSPATVSEPTPSRAATRQPATPVRSLSTEADAYAPPPIAPPRADPELAEAELASAPQPIATQPQADRAPTNSALSLPSLAEVEAQGLALPDMNLDVHVFSEDVTQRFVFLNGAKYREGETTRDGPRVVEIVAQGVVLDYQSQRFLMPWE